MFDPTITYGHLITVGGVVATIIIWGIRMQMNMRILTDKMDRIEKDLAELKAILVRDRA